MVPNKPDANGTPATPRVWTKPLIWIGVVVVGFPLCAAVCFGLFWLLVYLTHGPMFGR
jgi:hypothetical protein